MDVKLTQSEPILLKIEAWGHGLVDGDYLNSISACRRSSASIISPGVDNRVDVFDPVQFTVKQDLAARWPRCQWRFWVAAVVCRLPGLPAQRPK